jgi:hypothetical protein
MWTKETGNIGRWQKLRWKQRKCVRDVQRMDGGVASVQAHKF